MEQLRNDHLSFGNPEVLENRIFGTISETEDAPVPNGIWKSCSKAKKNVIMENLVSSDFAIFNLSLPGAQDEIDAAVKYFKEIPELKKDLVLIVISSVQSWAGTPAKDPANITENSDISIALDKRERMTTTDFIEEDFEMRMPSTRFAHLKHIENLVLQV